MREILTAKYGEEEALSKMKEMWEKTSKANKGRKLNFTEQHRKSLSDSRLNYYFRITEEEKKELNDKISIGLKKANLKRSDEYKEKMSISLKNKADQIHKKAECKYCGIITNISNISRWHNEKCKKSNK